MLSDGFVLSIIIGCLQVNDDNEEEESYAVQVITSENGRITNVSDDFNCRESNWSYCCISLFIF